MKENNFSDFIANVEPTEYAICVNEIWLDLCKFNDFAQFKAVVLDLCGNNANVHFEDFRGIPNEMFEKFKVDAEECFDDFVQYEMSDNETKRAYKHYLEYVSSYAYGCFEDFTEKYQGYFATETEFAEHFVDEIGLLDGVDSNLAMYFDYAAYARDLFLNGDFVYCNGYVFSRN